MQRNANHGDARVVLVRHGRSSHVHTGWIDSAGFCAWRALYEAAGIDESERAPSHLDQLAASAGLVLSSDAPRAIASARLIASAREVVVSPVLRELDLHAPDLGGLRLPLAAWAVAVGGRILLQTVRSQYPSAAEAARIDEAVGWLGELAIDHALIIAVTHASFRRQLANRLLQAGWESERRQRSVKHWSAWVFYRAGVTNVASPVSDRTTEA
ncbi:MAG: histidine phosphatase family protein [Acidobacteriota bacterium]|nr:histidine phosphatase family protein [Acidobacteriota bacterium]